MRYFTPLPTALLAALATLLLAACGPSETPTPDEEPPAPESAISAPPQAGATDEPRTLDIRSETLSYQVGDSTFTGYIAYDANQSGPRPGVLVVHEWWGHDDYVRQRADMLAELGYTALALDMYGEGKLAEHPEDAQQFMMAVMSNLELAEARFQAAKAVLHEHETTNPDKTAAIGYCFGGGVVLHMARRGLDLDGVASFHGSLATEAPARAGEVNAAVLVLNGADDPMVTEEQITAFKEEMSEAGVDYRFVNYPGAVHSFTNPGATAVGEEFDMPLAYDEDADQQSWAELEAFLARIFD